MGSPRRDLPTALEAFAHRTSRTSDSVAKARELVHALDRRLVALDLDTARFVVSAHDFETADGIEAREIAWADCQEVADRLARNVRMLTDAVDLEEAGNLAAQANR